RRRLSAYTAAFPELGAELTRRLAGELPSRWDEDLPVFSADAKGLATRKASEATLQALARKMPELIGGSADLEESTYTVLKGEGDFESPSLGKTGAQGAAGGPWDYTGRNIHFGIREHAMGAAVNGLIYHGGVIPFASTFLTFSDYMRPPVRLSALARLGSLSVYTRHTGGAREAWPT